ncbi:MAG: DUF2007 domain-containing protein [Gemmatimonadota bacterium]
MFCPSCGTEYRPGFDRCADCDVPLTEKAPPEPSHEGTDLVELTSTTDVGFLPLVKSVLDAAGIPYVVQGEEALGLLPVGAYSGREGPRPLRASILVPGDRLEEARSLLDSADDSPQTGEEA